MAITDERINQLISFVNSNPALSPKTVNDLDSALRQLLMLRNAKRYVEDTEPELDMVTLSGALSGVSE